MSRKEQIAHLENHINHLRGELKIGLMLDSLNAETRNNLRDRIAVAEKEKASLEQEIVVEEARLLQPIFNPGCPYCGREGCMCEG